MQSSSCTADKCTSVLIYFNLLSFISWKYLYLMLSRKGWAYNCRAKTLPRCALMGLVTFLRVMILFGFTLLAKDVHVRVSAYNRDTTFAK